MYENISEAYQILRYENRKKIYDSSEFDEANRMNVAELLKDRLDLYIDNEDEWEKLMENEISMLLKSSFSNFILESIG
ncbi:hypothetical protein PFNF135_04382 [Plasmodium falciparum NF135/5.C10]|uniref:DNAJ-containing protein X-domain domain-containing protein n=1 Tax=Plasmodium falciparum NF135/5.C10 TaxID=1036726 RepID=W4IDL6_PLAFA|nr:hypothetical protein PFNF135_04382 [Plasmodium falciparum NF135/5.C10]